MKSKQLILNKHAWIVVGILWIVALLNYLDRLLIASMRDPIVGTFNLNDAQFGLLTSVFLWVYALVSPFGGYFADKFSKKGVIVISLLVWSAVTLWTGFVRSFPEMLLARAVMGISEACYIPAAVALITEYHRGRTRSLATGLHISGLYAGMALGGVGGYIADIWGWRSGFQLFGMIGLVYAVFLFMILKDFPKEDQERKFSGMSATGYIQIASFPGVIIGGIIADRWSKKNAKGRLYMPVIGFTIGGIMVYIGGALKDAHVSLSLVFQVSAIVLLIASWSLLAIKPKLET